MHSRTLCCRSGAGGLHRPRRCCRGHSFHVHVRSLPCRCQSDDEPFRTPVPVVEAFTRACLSTRVANSQRLLLMGACCLAFAAPIAGHAQHQPRVRTFHVTIVDSVSGVPVSGAVVILGGDTAHAVRADSAGEASLHARLSHADTIRVTARGFRTYERRLDDRGEDVLIFDVHLARSVQLLESRRITEAKGASVDLGRLAGYNRRRAAGSGNIITREQIQLRSAVRVSDLFRGMPGLRVVDSASARLLVSSRTAQSSLVSTSANNDCVVPVAVDGLLREGSFEVDLLNLEEIEGIEVFVGIGTIPPEYSSMRKNAWCGLILVWTRDR